MANAMTRTRTRRCMLDLPSTSRISSVVRDRARMIGSTVGVSPAARWYSEAVTVSDDRADRHKARGHGAAVAG
jgi:hypothetical protein